MHLTNNEMFPTKLYNMLEGVEHDGLSQVVSWYSNGTAFKVHQHALFMDMIVSTYFNFKKYKSFLRQLSFYGFQRCNSGPHKGT